VFFLIFLLLFFGWPILPINQVPPAHAATFSMQTGYYVGTGATLAITNIGFQPQLIIIKAETAAGVGAVFKTSNMAANTTAYFPATANDTATFITLDATGFTLSSAANVNTVNVRFMWMAFAGSDCTSSGTFCVGSYTGDGGTTKALTSVGFTPDLVVIKGSSTTAAVWRSSSMPTNDGQFFTATAENTTSGLFTTLDSTGFTVGNLSNVNTNATTYQYFAFKEVASYMDVGTYTGNATDSTNITGVGFVPNAVFIKNANAATPTGAVYNITDSYGDFTETFIDAASAVDYIQSLRTDGFQVGADSRTNGSTNTLYYAAFAGEASYTSSGAFKMATGSYAGTGVAQSVTGLGFAPDWVMVKHTDQATDQYAVFRMKLMGGDSTAYFSNGAANFTGGITSMDSDGFTLGTDATVNTNADTYYWTAFGNAFNPHTHSGAADFEVGSYTGSGIDDRNITRMTFQPDFVAGKRIGSSRSSWRPSVLTGDKSSFFDATAETTDRFQAINSDGFQVGTTGINTVDSITWWYAFKIGTNFTVNTYTGSGAAQNITTPGFQPDLVWVKRSTAVGLVFRPSSLTGNNSQYVDNTPNATNLISDLISTGFSVTSTSTETNASAGTYRYAAWHAKIYDQDGFRLFNNANSTDVGTALAANNTAGSLASTGAQFRLRVLVNVARGNLYASGQNFKLQYVGKGTGTCASPSGGTPASYTDVDTTTKISYYNNSTPTDASNLTANASDPTDSATVTAQTYEELNNLTNTTAAVTKGNSGMWDFSLYDNAATASTAYCLRVVKSDGTALDTYDQYPQITTASSAQTLSFSISDSTIGFGTLSSSAARYATGDTSGNASETEAHTLTAATNATSGYIISVKGATLTHTVSSSYTITAIGSSNTASSAGTEQFGLRLGVTSGTGTATAPYAAAGFAYAADASTAKQVASGAGDGTSTIFSARYLANITTTSEAGPYTATLTYVVTATY